MKTWIYYREVLWISSRHKVPTMVVICPQPRILCTLLVELHWCLTPYNLGYHNFVPWFFGIGHLYLIMMYTMCMYKLKIFGFVYKVFIVFYLNLLKNSIDKGTTTTTWGASQNWRPSRLLSDNTHVQTFIPPTKKIVPLSNDQFQSNTSRTW